MPKYNIKLTSRPVFMGPQENSFSELFDVTGFCEFADDGVSDGPFDMTIMSDGKRVKESYPYWDNGVADTQISSSARPGLRHSVNMVPSEGVYGQFFQVALERQVPVNGNFKWFGFMVRSIALPSLDSEFMVNGGGVQDGWL